MREGIILNNRILDIVFLSMIIAQAIKVFSPLLKGKKIDFSRIFETGGMPSSHSSSVVSLSISIGVIKGINSLEFAITTVLAIIVMYDATGIRREAGKHARLLNKIIMDPNLKLLETPEFNSFKEFLGHTPLEVLMGALLGIAIPLIFRGYLL